MITTQLPLLKVYADISQAYTPLARYPIAPLRRLNIQVPRKLHLRFQARKPQPPLATRGGASLREARRGRDERVTHILRVQLGESRWER